MGWSTELFCNISFNRKSYNDKREVESDYKDVNDSIDRTKSRLLELVFTTDPQKYDSEDPAGYLRNNYEECMENLEETMFEKFRLGYLLDNWEYCHDKDGNAIPGQVEWNTAYLDGDFVKTQEKQ